MKLRQRPVVIETLESRRLLAADGIIVFNTNRDGNYEIYSMNPDGTNLKNLTNNSATDAIPQVSDDGTKVAFASDRGHPGNMEIFVMNIDGTGLTSITHGALPGASYWDPAPSPDDSKVLYMGPGVTGGYDIFVANADGTGNPVDVTPGTGGDFASWSDDGTKIVYGASPDGTNNEEVYYMNADGSGKTRVTNNPSRDSYPAFTPDGQHILFTTERDGNREIYSCNLDGSNLKNLTNNPSTDQVPYVNPDGDYVSFISYRDGQAEIYVMKIDGTDQTRITNNPAQDVYPGWGESPVSQSLPTLTVGDASVSEGDSGTVHASFKITLSAASASTVNISWATADGTATVAGNDYAAASGIATFAPGVVSQTINVAVKGDLNVEPNETFLVNLANPSNATISDGQGVGTIVNDDAFGQLQLSSSTYSVNENGSSVTITVTRTGGKAGAVGVSYATTNGSASAGSDYTAKTGTLAWASGDTASKAFTIPILDDSIYEGTESFSLALSNATGGASLGTTKTATVAILDNELPPPPPSGKIIFTSLRDGNPEIYSMNPDGSAQTRLTNNAAYDVLPSVAADGSKIVFASNRDNNDLEIYSMNPDGSAQTRLTNVPGTDYNPAITPDKSKVIFISTRSGNYDIWSMNADGSGQTNLTASNPSVDYYMSVNFTGTKILFSSDRATPNLYQMYSMNLDGTGVTRLLTSTANDVNAVMSPDGTKIAFQTDRDGNREIYLMNANGTGLVNLTKNAGADQSPYFSPDGTKLTFSSDRTGNMEIYTMNLDGTAVTKLTNNTTTDTYSVWGAAPTNTSSTKAAATLTPNTSIFSTSAIMSKKDDSLASGENLKTLLAG